MYLTTSKLIRGAHMPLLDGVATAGAPSLVTDGRATADFWKSPRNEKYLVCITKASGVGSVTFAGPVVIYGFANGNWYEVKRLNAAATITVNTVGYSEVVDFLGLWERIAMGGGAIGGGTVSAEAIELQNSLVR